jgi:hypothetical protein
MILSDKVVQTSGTGIISNSQFSTVNNSGSKENWVFSSGVNHPKVHRVIGKLPSSGMSVTKIVS